MLPAASNITMPSLVVSRIAPRSSASACPTDGTADGGGLATGVGSAAAATGVTTGATAALGVGEKIKASADSPSHEIVNRRPSVADAGVEASGLAVIVTAMPASDVLLDEVGP